jgi:hypothetical protein
MKKSGTGSFSRSSTRSVNMAPMPLEWLDRGTWRLPSGKALVEFALQSGFLAPLLLDRGTRPKTEKPDAGFVRSAEVRNGR